ncbi:MAG: hypothetical protein WBP13_04510 [Methylophilaceae bacterium]
MKNIKTMMAILSVVVFTTPAFADEPYGVNSDEQKATATVEAQKSEALEALNKACGTKATATINWKAYASFSASDLDGRTMDNVYQIAEAQTLDVLREMAFGCTSDAFYKSNVTKKLKAISFTPVKGEVSVKNPSHTYKLSNGTLAVNYNFQTTNSSINDVKKSF